MTELHIYIYDDPNFRKIHSGSNYIYDYVIKNNSILPTIKIINVKDIYDKIPDKNICFPHINYNGIIYEGCANIINLLESLKVKPKINSADEIEKIYDKPDNKNTFDTALEQAEKYEKERQEFEKQCEKKSLY